MNAHLPPLAERMRPTTLSDFVGQHHLVGPEGPLTRLAAAGALPSLLFWGPPGSGKTTLAHILAHDRPLHCLNAVEAGVKDVRAVLETARMFPGSLLFIDEIHRFNKAQQDALLNAVEKGLVTLIGATTENPSFEVIPALLSRCQVYVLEPLEVDDLKRMAERALTDDVVLKQRTVTIEEWDALLRLSGGDARRLLNLLELVVGQAPIDPVILTDALVTNLAQQHIARYDKDGEQHYDIISAFIKSIRGGDPNAGLYWLARMLEGGEDIRFIARRLIVLSSEDIGNANPNALLLATACFQACDVIGMPEARIVLAQAVTYLATSPKSNAAYVGVTEALAAVRQSNTYVVPPVPLHLRNAPTRLMKSMGYGNAYKYSHDYEGADGNQQYLPDELAGTTFYRPKDAGKERDIRAFLKNKWGETYDY